MFPEIDELVGFLSKAIKLEREKLELLTDAVYNIRDSYPNIQVVNTTSLGNIGVLVNPDNLIQWLAVTEERIVFLTNTFNNGVLNSTLYHLLRIEANFFKNVPGYREDWTIPAITERMNNSRA